MELSPKVSIRKHILVGAAAALLLLALYTIIIGIVQGLSHAYEQALKLWYLMALLAVGFGVQAGLFSFIRDARRRQARAATASVATSGGVSAGSMVACCAHHLSDVAAVIGLSGLAAFLVSYQTFFIVIGIVSNAVGIAMMLEVIQRQRLCPWVSQWRWNMRSVKRATMALAVVIPAAVLFTTLY